MSEAPPAGSPERALTALDCWALGVNGVIGSGVYLLLGPMAAQAGGAAVLATVLCAGLCLLAALCFAELTSMYSADGGPFLYGLEAFGRQVGFVVGWMSLVEGVVAFAAVASGFGGALATMVPVLAGRGTMLGAALVLFLTAVNVAGVRQGAWMVNVLSALKLVPLLLVAAVGVFHLSPPALHSVVRDAGNWHGVAAATFTASFMVSGFEYTAVPAGAARDPRRAIPRALVGSLLTATALYVVLQLVMGSVLPDLAHASEPLSEAAKRLLGKPGFTLIGWATVLSTAGFCAGSALVGPRYLTGLVEGRFLFTVLARRSRRGTPWLAVSLCGVAAAVLSLTVNFGALVDLSIIILFVQYLTAALAVPVLRRKRPTLERLYRVPGPAWLIPGLATVSILALLGAARLTWGQWRTALELLLLGLPLWALSALTGPRRAAPARPGPPA